MTINVTTDAGKMDNPAFVRLLCLNMVMQNGSERDRCEPCEKAARLAEFVMQGHREAVGEDAAPPVQKPKK